MCTITFEHLSHICSLFQGGFTLVTLPWASRSMALEWDIIVGPSCLWNQPSWRSNYCILWLCSVQTDIMDSSVSDPTNVHCGLSLLWSASLVFNSLILFLQKTLTNASSNWKSQHNMVTCCIRGEHSLSFTSIKIFLKPSIFPYKAFHLIYIHVWKIGKGKTVHSFKTIQFPSLIQKHKWKDNDKFLR